MNQCDSQCAVCVGTGPAQQSAGPMQRSGASNSQPVSKPAVARREKDDVLDSILDDVDNAAAEEALEMDEEGVMEEIGEEDVTDETGDEEAMDETGGEETDDEPDDGDAVSDS